MPDPIKDTVQQMPEPNPAALDQQAREGAESPDREPGPDEPRDLQGRVFDAKLHETLDDGSPRISPRGKLVRKRGRGSVNFDPSKSKSTVAPAENPDMQAQMAGKAAADATFMLGIVLGGPDWVPKGWEPSVGQNEAGMVSGAYAEYFKSKGVTEVPPIVGLAIALSAYAGPRLYTPSTRERFALVREWGKQKLIKWGLIKAKPNAPANSRPNNERQDDTGEKAG